MMSIHQLAVITVRHLYILWSAIDNATRGLISLGQLPVTCGLYFSLGHSTIVIVVVIILCHIPVICGWLSEFLLELRNSH